MSSTLAKSLLTAAVCAGMLGCGSDPGSGTGTLHVIANAVSDGTGQGTILGAIVRQGSSSGDCITDAQVTMIGEQGTEHVLPYVGLGGCFGQYIKNDLAWESGWRLRILSGEDRLEGFLQGPGLTTITNPTPGATFARSSGQALRVQWRDESGRTAETVEVRLARGEYNLIQPGDSGSREIPHTSWNDAEDNEQVFITRSSSVSLAGGVAGSSFEASTTDRVEFSVE